MIIYCDESGYSGDNLLEAEQPFFVYSDVYLSDNEINEIHSIIQKNYHVQSNELKGKDLVKTGRGKNIIKEIFFRYSKSARIIYVNKKYALAAKIFEYAIEPLLSGNSKYYGMGFHKFISIYLYTYLSTKKQEAEDLFVNFLGILRGKKIEELFSINPNVMPDYVCKMILEIAAKNAKAIYEEITTGGEIDKWILDLTMTSLMGILTEWNKSKTPLKVVCDESNLFLNNPIFERLNEIGLNDSSAMFLGTKIGFHLTEPIILEASKSSLGIQIADIFSSTVNYSLKNPHLDFSKYILARVHNNSLCSPNTWCIVPDYDVMNTKNLKSKFFPVLHHLHTSLT